MKKNILSLSLLSLSNSHVRRVNYSGALALRGYLPLFDSKVVALFGEGRITGTLGYGKMGSINIWTMSASLDWGIPFTVNPPESLVDYDNDEKIIGLGKLTIDKSMENYEKFNLDIKYRSDRTPKYVTIVLSSSALGDYFTGGVGSVFYLDEFKFLY